MNSESGEEKSDYLYMKRENELNIALLIFATFHFPHLLNRPSEWNYF
jgi:hypothetical protein